MKKSIVLLCTVIGLFCYSQQNSPILYFTIHTKDCTNCYLNVRNVFETFSKQNKYKIVLNDISDDKVFSFITKELNVSPSIKDVEINDSLYSKLNKNPSSSLIIVKNDEII